MIVVKQIEWEMGHRLLNHNSKCRNPHGHHYRLELSLQGEINSTKDQSNEGMVIDFGDIKIILVKQILDIVDHAFMVWDKDQILMKFYKENPDLKHIIVPFTTTAENMVLWIYDRLNPAIKKTSKNTKIKSVKLWETPTSYVEYSPNEQ